MWKHENKMVTAYICKKIQYQLENAKKKLK